MYKFLLTLTSILTLSGCLSINSYLHPKYITTSYSDIQPVTKKYTVLIVGDALLNGEEYSLLDVNVTWSSFLIQPS